MPIDEHGTTAAPPTRRAFLTRAAAGGALLGTGAALGPLGLLPTPAGAQEGGSDDGGSDDGDLAVAAPLSPEDFAAFAVPLELAAIQGYLAAFDAAELDDTAERFLRKIQSQHQEVVDALSPMLPSDPDVPEPVPNAAVVKATSSALDGAGDQDSVLKALSDLEVTTAASHLNALRLIDDMPLSKTVGQVLATESQHAAFLGVQAGEALDTLTPRLVSTEGARTNLNEGVALPDDEPSQTTTTIAGRDSTGSDPANKPEGPGGVSNTPGVREDGN